MNRWVTEFQLCYDCLLSFRAPPPKQSYCPSVIFSRVFKNMYPSSGKYINPTCTHNRIPTHISPVRLCHGIIPWLGASPRFFYLLAAPLFIEVAVNLPAQHHQELFHGPWLTLADVADHIISHLKTKFFENFPVTYNNILLQCIHLQYNVICILPWISGDPERYDLWCLN